MGSLATSAGTYTVEIFLMIYPMLFLMITAITVASLWLINL